MITGAVVHNITINYERGNGEKEIFVKFNDNKMTASDTIVKHHF